MLVIIRGAGDIATGITLRLHRSGYRLILTDLPQPTSIRRTVCFSEAVWRGRCTVEDTEAVLAHTPQEALALTEQGWVAVLTDPESACIRQLHPNGVVDAGVFHPEMEIGQLVHAGDIAATVNGVPMVCAIDGCLRGLLHEGLTVFSGMKCGDVDPRGNAANCVTASDKALAVGGGVLEALLHFGCLPDQRI